MWPMLLDMTEEESIQSLRHLELEAYSSLISALRAQGHLDQEKRKLLKETGIVLNISSERHKAEVRRAISDERLNTIAYHITGQLTSLEDWAQEGRRLVPLLPRVPPQTPYSIIADDASDAAVQYNKQLPLPANTERKRPSVPLSVAPTVPSSDPVVKPQTFRIPEVPKDDFKKRKREITGENSSLAQHLLGPKLSRIQQIYRQTSKLPAKQKNKDTVEEPEHQDLVKVNANTFSQQNKVTLPGTAPLLNNNTPKINVIQNKLITPALQAEPMVLEEHVNKPASDLGPVNENQAPNQKIVNVKPNTVCVTRQSTCEPVIDVDRGVDVSFKPSATRTINKGQKLIVVTNAPPTVTTNSMLQKTLSVPINKLTKLNLDKFKIVPNSQFPASVTNTSKPKLVTLKGGSGKKVIPLSQLQMLNSKGGLKVLPYGGKVFDKHITLANLQPRRTLLSLTSTKPEEITQTTSVCTEVVQVERVKSAENDVNVVNGDIELKDGEFQQYNSNQFDSESTESNSESNETTDNDSNEDCNVANMTEVDPYTSTDLEIKHTDDLLDEYEVFHSEEVLN